jgi:hypothetical protein
VTSDYRKQRWQPGSLTDVLRCTHVTGAEVLVGVAQAGGHEADEDLVLARRVELQLDDLPVGLRCPEDGCPGLHGVFFSPVLTVNSNILRPGAAHN